MTVRKFDLNIEQVLEHWAVPQAIREIIANALDEQALTTTNDPEITKDEQGRWHIRDWGRGLRYEHLTQNENREKLKNPHLVIGKFGVGLKDALAALDRRRVAITISSRYGTITTGKDKKHGFENLSTLHALIDDPIDPQMVGTDVVLSGVRDEEMETAKSYFLRFSGDELLEKTVYGEVLKRAEGRRAMAKIYVNGLRVADEANFLFSYNVTAPTKQLLRALNRERSNVGRSAYTDRVKDILLASKDHRVVNLLARDLQLMERGTSHDELLWINVAVHACQVLNTLERVIFVTAMETILYPTVIDHARADGLRIVIVPETVRAKLPGVLDGSEQPIRDLNQFLTEWDRSFKYTFISEDELTDEERTIWSKRIDIFRLGGGKPRAVKEVKISSTMRLEGQGYSEALGSWNPAEGFVVIRRDQLSNLRSFAGTLLHEIVHARTDNADDLTNEFVHGLTETLGVIADKGLSLMKEKKRHPR